jgi:hypothetical protein
MKQATANIPPTDFNQPPPLTPVQDQLDQQLRGGIDSGAARYPVVVGDGGPYQEVPTAPPAQAPTTLPPETVPPTFPPPESPPTTTSSGFFPGVP